MTITGMTLHACVKLEKWAKEAGIHYASTLSEDGEEIRLYDMTLPDTGFNILIRPNEIHIYNNDYDVYVDRLEFVNLTII